LGLESCSFAAAEDYLRSARLRDSDCVIADVQMPGMNGLELQEVMLAQALLVPIIFITAFPAPRIRERAEAAGAVAIVEKPFDAQVIVDSLDMAFERLEKRDFPESREPAKNSAGLSHCPVPSKITPSLHLVLSGGFALGAPKARSENAEEECKPVRRIT
jgi:FixJ family two-component response regulator